MTRSCRSGIPRVRDLNPGRLPAYGEVLAGVLDGTGRCRSAVIRPRGDEVAPKVSNESE